MMNWGAIGGQRPKVPSRRALRAGLQRWFARSACVLVLGFVWGTLLHGAVAYAGLASPSNNATGSSCSGSNNSDGFCGFSTSIPINTSTQLQFRYAWNINADVGIFSTRDTAGTATHNISFTATAVKGYQLNVTPQITGIAQVNNDASGCNGRATINAVTGSTNITPNSGSVTGWFGGANTGNTGGAQIPFNNSGSAVYQRLSNGAPQTHTFTFTWSGSVRSNSCEAAVRVGQQNGSTTGCGACEYPGSPSRTQSSDGQFLTVTFQELCGDGVVQGSLGEQCDLGAANGQPTSCCTADCQLRAAGQTCRAAVSVCDVTETCTGTSATCPADTFAPGGTLCRGAAGICDVSEFCTGTSNTCPADTFQPASVVCRAATDLCDAAENCTGTSASCPADVPLPNGTFCRAAGGDCDVDDYCTGTSKVCPQTYKPNTVVCRASGGVCDVAENCTGTSATCPSDAKQPNTFTCRAASGPCDVAENCDGVSNNCPADAVRPSGYVCRAAAGVCDIAETCDGVNKTCPTDAKSTAVCRPAADVCDVAESCDGVNDDCPSDAFKSAATECRAAAGVCDVAENCTGTAAACPPDLKQPNTVTCRPVADVCDVAENCTGTSDHCPTDTFLPATTLCRAGSGNPNGGSVCDPDEYCTGTQAACPPDVVQPAGTVCNPGSGNPNGGSVCDPDEVCSGVPGQPCPADTFANSSTVCRLGTEAADGARDAVCDPTEYCPGVADQPCPADFVRPAGFVCDVGSGNPNGGSVCDPNEVCSGVAGQPCPPDTFANNSVVCRLGTEAADSTRDAVCDPTEYCPGVPNAPCPVDVVSPPTTVCDVGSGNPNGGSVCDPDEHCSGVAGQPCPPDFIQPAGTVCNAGTDAADASRDAICDPQEVCSGFADDPCPPDFVRPAGTVCDVGSGNPNGGSVCDPDEVCSGNPDDPCPSDTFASSSVVCRADAGECDVGENCPGSPNQPCPPDSFEPSGAACGDPTDNDCTNPDTCDGAGNCLSNHEPANVQCWGPDPNSNGFNPLGNTCKYACDGSGSCQPHITPNCCGNGIVEAGEQCDDGNQYSGLPPAPDGSLEFCPSDPAFHCQFVAGTTSLYVRGTSRDPATDVKSCQVEFFVVNPNNPPDRYGLADYRQTCQDQDPTCDFDPLPGRCGFITVACVNVSDPNLPACSPAANQGVRELNVMPLSTALSLFPVAVAQYQANTTALGQALTQLFDPANPGAGFTNQAPLLPSQQNLCSSPRILTVFSGTNRPNESARARFSLRVKSKDGRLPVGRQKRTLLRLTCKARPLP